MSFLQIRNLTKKYDNSTQSAIKNINIEIEKGEFISIIGPSGAGKSTLLNSFNRLIEPTSGTILFENKNVSLFGKKDLRKYRSNIGMIFQHYNLVERLSVLENVLHGRLGSKSAIKGMMGIYTEEEVTKAKAILKKLGLENQIKKRCDELSGGQKQRVGIARALIQDPKLILCDEPIASLDPKSSKVTMDLLKDIVEEMGITCIVNLHQVDYALDYSSRIIALNNGQIVYDDIPSKLNDNTIKDIYHNEA